MYQDDHYVVYKNPTAYPRFKLFYAAQTVSSDKEALALIAHDSVDFTKKVLLEEKLPIELKLGTGSARLISSTVNSQTFSMQSTTPAIFYVSDTYFPGWTATVNNRKTKIYRANYNFRAVAVPSGTSTITFSYTPSLFRLYIFISALSMLLLSILPLLPRWRKRRQK